MAFGTANVITTVGKGVINNRIKGAGTEPNYLAAGVGATSSGRTASVTDTALSSEVQSRVAGTSSIVTTSVSNDTYQVVGTITATASRAIDEAGLFDASTAGNLVASSTFPAVNLITGDSIEFVAKIQLG